MYKNYLSENLQYFFEIGLDKKDLAHVSDLNSKFREWIS